MIRIITLDRNGQPAVVENIKTFSLSNDVIIMNPGMPQVHTPEFDDYLRTIRNATAIVLSLSKPDTAARLVKFWRPDLFTCGGQS
jgi:hypothetical protein